MESVNESFLKDVEEVSNLKLRISYGQTGNLSIDPYQSLATNGGLYASTSGQTVSAIAPNQPANLDLKWETSHQTNYGLDLGMFSDRLSFSVDYYNIDTKDVILVNTGIPEYSGFLNDEILTNLGEINNSGFEFSLNTENISMEDFKWNTSFNISFNKNKVVSLVDKADMFGSGAPSYFSGVKETYILREGEEVGLFWGYEYRGVYQGGDLPEGKLLCQVL